MLFYEPLSIGKIVNLTFKVIFINIKNFLKVFIIYFVIVIVILLLSGLLFFSLAKPYNFIFSKNFPYILKDANFIMTVSILLIIFFVIILIISVCYSIMNFDICIKAFLEEKWELRSSFNLVKQKFFSSLGLSILSFLLILAGFLLCCIGFLPIRVLIVFAFPLLLFENTKTFRAISRSIDLVSKNFWDIFGKIILLFIMIIIFNGVYNIFFNIIFQLYFQLPLWKFLTLTNYKELFLNNMFFLLLIILIFFINQTIYTTFINIFTTAYYVLLYFNHIIKYEKLTIEDNSSKNL